MGTQRVTGGKGGNLIHYDNIGERPIRLEVTDRTATEADCLNRAERRAFRKWKQQQETTND